MPTYQYRCAKCGEQFETWQSIHDDALTVHDGDCGGALAKVMAVGGIVLKGSGFYRTDNRSSSRNKDAKAAESAGGKDGKAAESTGGNGSGDKDAGKSDKKDTKTSDASSKSDASKT